MEDEIMAKDIKKVEELADVMADFMNGVTSGEKGAFENAISTLKHRYELSKEQEAMVRISLIGLEQLTNHADDGFNLDGFVGLNCNVLFWVIAGDYDIINRRVLADITEGN
jgi:hypothetical protein